MGKLPPGLLLALLAATPQAASAGTHRATQAASQPGVVPAPSLPQAETAALSRLAPSADPRVLSMALSAMRCAQASGTGGNARRLAVIDYSRSSLLPRMWVFDVAADKLLYEEWVAHGQGSGDDVPDRFSNAHGSHQSSLGLFHTLGTYHGANGYSLRMQGLEAGINDAALPRAIVVHGADYVDPQRGKHMGRLGRSWGCPAVRRAIARPLIDALSGGQFVFAYAPDPHWLSDSPYISCAQSAPGHAIVMHAARGARGPG